MSETRWYNLRYERQAQGNCSRGHRVEMQWHATSYRGPLHADVMVPVEYACPAPENAMQVHSNLTFESTADGAGYMLHGWACCILSCCPPPPPPPPPFPPLGAMSHNNGPSCLSLHVSHNCLAIHQRNEYPLHFQPSAGCTGSP